MKKNNLKIKHYFSVLTSKFSPSRGQTLVEAVVALGVGVIILSALTVAVVYALVNAQNSKNVNLATQYAQEGIEILREKKIENWSAFSSINKSYQYCLDGDSTDLVQKFTGVEAGCATALGDENKNVDGFFARKVFFDNDSNCLLSEGAIRATVTVMWNSSKCSLSNIFCNQVVNVACFRQNE